MKYYEVGYDDHYGLSCFIEESYSNREAAQAAADWHNAHPSVSAMQYGIYLTVHERIVPDVFLGSFVPPMTDEEYERSLHEDPEYQYMIACEEQREREESCFGEPLYTDFNIKMSGKYNLHIYNSENPQFPYYVEEWGECFTENEIAEKSHA